jgi:hypothetical protein
MNYKLFFYSLIIFYIFYKTINGIYQYGTVGYLEKESERKIQRNVNLVNFVKQKY